MARVSKIDNAFKKRLARQEKGRSIDNREKRVYFLIICEGEKTEPNYFEGLKKDLPVGTVVIADMTIQGTGKNTESLVDFTLKFRKRSNQKFDRAKRLRESFTDGKHADHNPCTLVYLLIEELFNPGELLGK